MHSSIIRVLFCTAICATFALGCKSKKKAANNEKPPVMMEATEESRARKQDMMMTAPKEAGPEEATEKIDDSGEQKPVEYKDFPNNLVASIERTPCFGQCATYKVNVYANGDATYEGKRFAPREGLFVGKFTQEQVDQLLQKGRDINYLSLKEEYDGPVTDLPSTITRLQLDGTKKQVKSRWKTPDEVREFEKFFDQIVDSISWTEGSLNED